MEVLKNQYPCTVAYEITQMAFTMWQLGWDERNGGNISYIVKEEELVSDIDLHGETRHIPLNFDFESSLLDGKLLLITASGSYFRNMLDFPEKNIGLVRLDLTGKKLDVLWGLEGGGVPTSELATHLMSHETRLSVDPEHRIVLHNHATNIVALTLREPADEKRVSLLLWKTLTECIFIFPEGVGIVPWMPPGTAKLGKATSGKMEKFRIVIWPGHGILAAGNSVEEAFGLIETVDKSANIYMLAGSQAEYFLTEDQLRLLCNENNLQVNKELLELQIEEV
ncbi:rhamnulose-1-phosphate aldolase [Brevibacillus daliensis]|uniref:rhamnulose-1-phosphate aldolase n=1 Tax=Brevibacillus daliensis TaxID=2892995 RepID=UPI001E2F030E|nr:rhamnulose-1-phosphate aldolase [Brevibacillus daliensis]